MVYYRTVDGSGYRWKQEGGSAKTLAQSLYDEGSVERRVLDVPSEDLTICIEDHLTPQSYTATLRRKALWESGLSSAVLVVYAVWGGRTALRRRREREAG